MEKASVFPSNQECKESSSDDLVVRNNKYIQLSNVLSAVQPYFLNTISQRVSYVVTNLYRSRIVWQRLILKVLFILAIINALPIKPFELI